MFVSANTYSRVKNKWQNQQIHKIHNDIHYASKHYGNCDNDIIFTSKHPINQRRYRKKFETTRKRENIYKEIAFDYNDFVFKNKNENYKRIIIRPTIYYNHYEPIHITNLFYYFYKGNHSDPFIRKHSINTRFIKTNHKASNTKTKQKKQSETKETKVFDAALYDLDHYQCSLFEGDKVDIFDDKYKHWFIGTIIQINKDKDKELCLLLHYDGFSSIYDEKVISNHQRIKKLHSITPYHDYEVNNNLKICTKRKYVECLYCNKKYCIKCMDYYLNDDNECNECIKTIKKNKWLKKLKDGDKLDIYLYGYKGSVYNDKWYCGWNIGTVIQIRNTNHTNKFKIRVHFDGLETEYDEWIDIDCSLKSIRYKLKKLNKITLVHNYILNDNVNTCVEVNDWKKCVSCHWKYCLKCIEKGIIIRDIGYQCIECGITKEGKDLFDMICDTLFDTYYDMKMNIIDVIYGYSMGITVQCCNQVKKCLNEINFDTKYEMELNAQRNNEEIYQYYLYKTSNITPNITIYNRKRRIFCKECSENELIKCILCNKNKEIGSKGYNKNIIYKCKYCLNAVKEKKLEKETIKVHKIEVNAINKCVDIHFKKFKDDIFPQIVLKKSRRNQNMKALREILFLHHVHIEDLPYNLYDEECKFGSKCGREYCSFYHCNKEKELGDIISTLIQKIKFEKQLNSMWVYRRSLNEELMDYDFNLQYFEKKMMKRRNNNILRKYNVKRTTNKSRKKRAYFLRKKDKRCNVKQNKKFKTKYYLRLATEYMN